MDTEQESIQCPACKEAFLKLVSVPVCKLRIHVFYTCEHCWFQCNEEHLPKLAALEKQRASLKRAIMDCIEYANGREYEWGNRAIDAFNILHEALAQLEEIEE